MEAAGVQRKLTAILNADVQGYSRLMAADEAATVRTITAYRGAMTVLVGAHRGRVVDFTGDNLLAEFPSVVDAIQCAVEIQRDLETRNAALPEERRMRFRIGINLGDVIVDGERIYGDGVNVAARVQALSNAGGVAISGMVYDSIGSKLPYRYESLGEHRVKNIPDPIRVFRVAMATGAEAREGTARVRRSHRTMLATAALVAAVLVLAAAEAVWQFHVRPSRARLDTASIEKMAFPLPDKPSIAVLPFTNLSGDPKQDYLSDGFTEEIITALSRVPTLFVIASNSSFTYKGRPVRVQQVAQDLGVRYVLEGSVRRTDEKVRITAQLIDATTGRHLWADRYDGELKDLFALQDGITLKILVGLQVQLTEGERARAMAKGTRNLQAYLKLLESREHTDRLTQADSAVGRRLAEEAMALDPGYAMAYLRLSATHLLDMQFGWSESPARSLDVAETLVRKALALDDQFADAHAFLGRVLLTRRQHDAAIAEGERALAMAPNSAFVHAALAFSLRNAGRREEAVALFRKAIRLDPIAPSPTLVMLGTTYGQLGRYEEAIAEYKTALQRSPDNIGAHLGLTGTYMQMGREEEARAEAGEVLRIDPKFSLERFAKGLMYKDQTETDRLIDALSRAGLK